METDGEHDIATHRMRRYITDQLFTPEFMARTVLEVFQGEIELGEATGENNIMIEW